MKKAKRQYRRNQREIEKVRKAAPRKAKVRAIKRGAKQVATRQAKKEADGVVADFVGHVHSFPKDVKVSLAGSRLIPVPGRQGFTGRGGYTPPGAPANPDRVTWTRTVEAQRRGPLPTTGAGYPVDEAIFQAWNTAGLR